MSVVFTRRCLVLPTLKQTFRNLDEFQYKCTDRNKEINFFLMYGCVCDTYS